jgi:hypothetical protein
MAEYTKKEIYERLVRADEEGDTESVNTLKAYIRKVLKRLLEVLRIQQRKSLVLIKFLPLMIYTKPKL